MSEVPGLQELPADIVSLADYERHARRILDPNARAYFRATAGDGLTDRANRQAWDAIALLPRVLRPLAGLQTRRTLLGRELPTPLLVAPMALQRLAHPDGEVAMALAAAAQGAGMVLSCQASMPMETVARSVLPDGGRGPLWLQLYLFPDRGITLELVRRAEAAGYEALVITVDANMRAQRAAEQRVGFKVPAGIGPVNLPPQRGTAPTELEGLLAQAPTWDDLAWLQAQTRLPILVKGILHPEDAGQAARLQLAGVIVSNHGGRTLDTAAATVQALPRVADAVAGALPLLVDGGIRRGTDVLKALALGAQAVLVGRAVLWALATAGALGAAHGLRLLRDEFELAMAQCGAASLDAIDGGLLLPR
ncbi:MAG TPA: alpha-hydroxy acid oxidase [Ramlibacter sp.]|nr:alpha-hydroxy acid oxidase [Ramlibacter sp.]